METIYERLGDSIVVGYPAPCAHLTASRRWSIPAFLPIDWLKKQKDANGTHD